MYVKQEHHSIDYKNINTLNCKYIQNILYHPNVGILIYPVEHGCIH